MNLAFVPVEDAAIEDSSIEDQIITMEEIQEHNSRKDCWMVINGRVYDLTKSIEGDRGGHPGGAEILLAMGGADGTSDFEFIQHSKYAHRLLRHYRIGRLPSKDVKNTMLMKEVVRVEKGIKRAGASLTDLRKYGVRKDEPSSSEKPLDHRRSVSVN